MNVQDDDVGFCLVCKHLDHFLSEPGTTTGDDYGFGTLDVKGPRDSLFPDMPVIQRQAVQEPVEVDDHADTEQNLEDFERGVRAKGDAVAGGEGDTEGQGEFLFRREPWDLGQDGRVESGVQE